MWDGWIEPERSRFIIELEKMGISSDLLIGNSPEEFKEIS